MRQERTGDPATDPVCVNPVRSNTAADKHLTRMSMEVARTASRDAVQIDDDSRQNPAYRVTGNAPFLFVSHVTMITNTVFLRYTDQTSRQDPFDAPKIESIRRTT